MATTSPLLARRRAGTAAAVPLTLITGFLGAGKTTLLNRLLSGGHGLRVAVLVNDFGAVNIDAELVVGVEDGMLSLANGCVCCEIRDDLIDAVDRLTVRQPPPEFVVIEASGVADPAGIYATFAASEHRDRFRLDSITCVVDAEQIFAHFKQAPGLLMLKARQIGCSDLVVLNKIDLAGEEQVAAVRAWIDGMTNRVRIVETSFGDVPHEVLLGVGRFDPATPFGETQLAALEAPTGVEAGLDHGDLFARFLYESERPFDLDALREMVRRDLPASVYRCKGVVYAMGQPETRLVLQAVGRRTDLEPLGRWGDETRRSRIVAIGDRERMDSAALRAAFDACLAD